MNAEEIREYALSKDDATESFPFGEETLVFKAGSKIFLLMSLDADPLQFNLKCDPDRALELRDQYPDAILPGYHMNKKHWNTVIAQSIKNKLIIELIDHSYDLAAPKKKTK